MKHTEPRPFQKDDEVSVAVNSGWTPSGGRELATLMMPHPQSGAGMWLVQFSGRQDIVHERRFTLEETADTDELTA